MSERRPTSTYLAITRLLLWVEGTEQHLQLIDRLIAFLFHINPWLLKAETFLVVRINFTFGI